MYSLLTPPHDAIDAAWHEQLQAIAAEAAEVYFALEPSAASLHEARQLFANEGYRGNPALRPQLPDLALYEQRTQELFALQARIVSDEQNADIRQAYVNRIDELLSQIRILRAGYGRDAAEFALANQAVYGSPDTSIFAATCAWYRGFAEKQLEHSDPAIQSSAQRVLELLPNVAGDAATIVPSNDTFATVKTMHSLPNGYLFQLLAGVSIPQHVTEQTGPAILSKVLTNIGCNYSLVEASSGGWGVSHSRQAILHPKHYDRSDKAFTGLITHEIGSHLLERINGANQPLRLLATGLDRYEACNEGRANLREQIVFESPVELVQQDSWRHITTLHFAISLASGLYDHTYSFEQVYETLYPINLLWQQLHGLSGAQAEAAAHDNTWATTVRVLKGTEGTGGAYLKDMVYLEGNVRCWQLAKTRPEMILYGDLGKFDITRADHVALLRGLGILP